MNRKRTGRIRTLLGALGLTAVMLSQTAYAEPYEPVDLSRECSITVHPHADDEAFADLGQEDVVLDLYKVADAQPVSGQDAYVYTKEALDDGGLVSIEQGDLSDLDQDGWKELAQQAAEKALAEDSQVVPVRVGAAAGTKIEGLSAGLYLIVARGKDLAEKSDYVTSVTEEESGGEEITRLATVAMSDRHIYTFLPQLISVPSRDDGEGNNTANVDVPWQYDADIYLKPEQGERYGGLEIVKELRSYETADPATFVFSVEAYADETMAERLYSNVVSMTFTEPGVVSTLIEDVLPVGSYVVVTEVYSGASYGVAVGSSDTASAVIEANDVVSVRFTNEYIGRRGGGAVTNGFSFDDEALSWTWTQSPAQE